MKLSTIINAQQSLTKLANSDLPVKIAYSLSKTIQKLSVEFKAFDEARNKLFEKYGEEIEEKTKTGQPNRYKKIKNENIEEFQKEINKLLDLEVEVDFKKIKVSNLEKVNLSAIDLTNLEFILEE